LANGALGVTTNPILTYKTVQAHPDYWKPMFDGLSDSLAPEERAEAILKAVATDAAKRVEPIYERTGAKHGYALGQLNPSDAGDAAAMLRMAKRVQGWAANVSVKLPTTRAGLIVIEEMSAAGLPVCATINLSVSQAVAVGESYRRGVARAMINGVKPKPCFAVQQVGRLDDYIRDVAKDSGEGVSESDVIWAGIAVAKRSYAIFKEMGYEAVIMPAGLRGVHHMTELAGADMTFSLHPRIQKMLLDAEPSREEGIQRQVGGGIINRLMKLPEFVRAYEPDALKPDEFITYGATQKILSQFVETGWSPLETYGSNIPSLRW